MLSLFLAKLLPQVAYLPLKDLLLLAHCLELSYVIELVIQLRDLVPEQAVLALISLVLPLEHLLDFASVAFVVA